MLYQELFEYFNYERKYVKKSHFFKKSYGKNKISRSNIEKNTEKSYNKL
ncbi:hypothetical protein STRINF_00106 [Streptococcus infantarius subsp. infantarius ATCC BAA-102]|uniref:Uncharacterized protein n=1 Tax=Streptococcus infantarius subsp. infantarius ATCC BAA-102 TaxID=471872 RepID=A0ABM9XH34_9STRE|nr:hypothetical protein STRINF_00106 [Streptococcus infantarius subsp. infantarius ATCC BAA-102]